MYDLNILIDGLLRDDMKIKYLGKQGDRVVYHYPELVESNDNKVINVSDKEEQSLGNQKTENSDSSSEDDQDPASHQAKPQVQN